MPPKQTRSEKRIFESSPPPAAKKTRLAAKDDQVQPTSANSLAMPPPPPPAEPFPATQRCFHSSLYSHRTPNSPTSS
ncbi:hypothetical protein NLI96_g12065 [Meripilus lineatus]|uniref:Uncharacterized protein n=1 Tax=Meripilus lineatus TaxID=2056292 RepID=A0AAD5US11_9APHY|nr:hypothetical protein NLI96_g12065 [Physisporinus lineatus]